jgi:imidazolonepropionase
MNSDPSMSTLVRNISELVTQSDDFPQRALEYAFVFDSGVITWVGPESEAPQTEHAIDAHHGAVLPGFVDSHAHLIFAGDRSADFAARMVGEKYSAGGIASTVAATRSATDEQLRANVQRLVDSMTDHGITTFEIKSGYGLTVADELRALRIAREFTPETTFLGAHVVPIEYREDPNAYVDLVCGDMLATCAPYAKWIDVFCDEGAFTPEQTARILGAGREAGLNVRLHSNQIASVGGIDVAAEFGAVSVDHLTYMSDQELEAMSTHNMVATLLPGVEFSTRSPYPDARRFMDAGVTVALATDCNPGTSFITSMPFVIALAVREMHMSVDQAVWSATAGGAAALGRSDIGRIDVGKRADFLILDRPSIDFLAYNPGTSPVAHVFREGQLVRSSHE